MSLDSAQAAARSAATPAANAADGVVGAQTPVHALAEPAPQSAFNPFGSVGVVVQTSAPAALPPLQSGDWALPIAGALAGFVLVAWMLHKMAQ